MQSGKLVLVFGLVVLAGLGAYWYMQMQMPAEDADMMTPTSTEEAMDDETSTTPSAGGTPTQGGSSSVANPTPSNESVDDIIDATVSGGDSEAADTAGEDADAALLEAEAEAAADYSDSYDESTF